MGAFRRPKQTTSTGARTISKVLIFCGYCLLFSEGMTSGVEYPTEKEVEDAGFFPVREPGDCPSTGNIPKRDIIP